MKKFGVDWRFCPECQKIQHYIVNDIATGSATEWSHCDHDYRPNSAKAVLENQAKELAELALAPYTVRTYQSPWELENFLYFARDFVGDHPVVVEIGSFHGGTANRIDQEFDPEKLICVDRCFDFWLADDLDCVKIQGDSVESLGRVKDELADREIDLLFIDGDHSYRGEMADFRAYSPLVRDGGVIALHDTHSILDVGRVFAEIHGKVKVDIFSYQGIGLLVK